MRLPIAASLPFLVMALLALELPTPAAQQPDREKINREVQVGLRDFFEKTAEPDGSFRPGIDAAYKGMADTAASDLAAPAYAVILHRTFGWKLPHEAKTREFFLARQVRDGAFFHKKGIDDPKLPATRLCDMTLALVALRGLGVKPRHDPRPALDALWQAKDKTLPPQAACCLPLAYLAAGLPFPKEADAKARALLAQADDGYLNNHIALTFRMVHYYRLLGQKTPKAEEIVQRVLRDQKRDGSWLLNPPARDRHATFAAVFVLRQLGGDRQDVQKAIARAATWALSCRNEDGGFGHYPGSTSDADAVYYHVATLVMAEVLRPVSPLPSEPQLLGWGHLMPRP